jgi:hypothetical protein
MTPRQELFVEYYINRESEGFGNATKSAELAGYGGDYNSIKVLGCNLLKNPLIIKAIDERRNDIRRMFNQEALNSFNTLIALRDNQKVSARVRLDACKDILDRAGYKPSDKVELTGKDGDSLFTRETRYTKEIASRARLLSVIPETLDVIDALEEEPIEVEKEE